MLHGIASFQTSRELLQQHADTFGAVKMKEKICTYKCKNSKRKAEIYIVNNDFFRIDFFCDNGTSFYETSKHENDLRGLARLFTDTEEPFQ
jgi:hypothetical protein